MDFVISSLSFGRNIYNDYQHICRWEELGINPNTVSKAYKMLEADGYIYSTVGRGSFVSDKLCQDEAEKIAARQELKSALKKAYKKGVTKEEIVNMIEQIIEGVDIE